MDVNTALLQELVALHQASLRLQGLSITLQAEALAYLGHATTGGKRSPTLEKAVMRAVQQMRATIERVQAGKRLPK